MCERDINGEHGSIRVHDGKGHKPRTVGLDAMAFGLIDRWIRTSLATTSVYVNHLGAEDVIAISRERAEW